MSRIDADTLPESSSSASAPPPKAIASGVDSSRYSTRFRSTGAVKTTLRDPVERSISAIVYSQPLSWSMYDCAQRPSSRRNPSWRSAPASSQTVLPDARSTARRLVWLITIADPPLAATRPSDVARDPLVVPVAGSKAETTQVSPSQSAVAPAEPAGSSATTRKTSGPRLDGALGAG